MVIKNEFHFEELKRLLNLGKDLKGDECHRFLFASDFIDQLSIFGSFYFSFIDLCKMTYQYVSPSVKIVTGYSASEFMKKGVNFNFAIYHHDLLMTQRAIHIELFDFIKSVAKKERVDYKYSYNFMVKHANGKYIKLLQHSRIVEFDKAGNPLLMLAICHEISDFSKENKQTLVISKLKKGKEIIVLKKDFFPEFENGVLTRKEIEVWKLISDGLSSKEIASQLNIKLNTVFTHRKKIHKKLKAIKV